METDSCEDIQRWIEKIIYIVYVNIRIYVSVIHTTKKKIPSYDVNRKT